MFSFTKYSSVRFSKDVQLDQVHVSHTSSLTFSGIGAIFVFYRVNMGCACLTTQICFTLLCSWIAYQADHLNLLQFVTSWSRLTVRDTYLLTDSYTAKILCFLWQTRVIDACSLGRLVCFSQVVNYKEHQKWVISCVLDPLYSRLLLWQGEVSLYHITQPSALREWKKTWM